MKFNNITFRQAIESIERFAQGEHMRPIDVKGQILKNACDSDLYAHIYRVTQIPVYKGTAPIYKCSKVHARIANISDNCIVYGGLKADVLYIQDGKILTREHALGLALKSHISELDARPPLEKNIVFRDDGELAIGFVSEWDKVIGLKLVH